VVVGTIAILNELNLVGVLVPLVDVFLVYTLSEEEFGVDVCKVVHILIVKQHDAFFVHFPDAAEDLHSVVDGHFVDEVHFVLEGTVLDRIHQHVQLVPTALGQVVLVVDVPDEGFALNGLGVLEVLEQNHLGDAAREEYVEDPAHDHAEDR